MQRSKRVRGPSRTIYTRGVKDHSAKARDASVCISLNSGRVTTEQLKGARVATISPQEQYRDTHPSGPQSIHYGHADNTLELEITNPSLAEVGQTGNSANGSYNSQFTQILCRQDQPVSSELEGTEQGQMGPTNCDRRISHPTFVHPLARDLAAQPSVFIRESGPAAGGGSWPAGEAGNPISPKSDQGILLQHVYGTKERWRSETSYQPKKTEQPCEVRALQDGEPSHCEVSHTEGRLDDEDRPEGCLLHGTSSLPVPTSPSLQSECRVIQIPMSPLRPMHGPESIHESPETSHRAIEDSRHQTCDLHGRHAAHGLFRTDNPRAHLHSPISPREPGVHHQQQEVLTVTFPTNRFSRDDSGFSSHGAKITWRKDQEDQNRSTESPNPARGPGSLRCTAVGQAECNQPSSSSSPPVLSLTPNMPQTFPGCQFPKLPVNSQTISSGSGGHAVVDTSSNILEWKEPNLPSLQDDDRLRCLSSGMGSHLQRNINQGPLVSSGADSPYQLLGAPGSYSGSSNLCQGKVRHLNPVEDRQHNCSGLYQQERGNCVPHSIESSQDPVAVVYGEEHRPGSPVLTRSHELHCRQGIQNLVGQIRMEALSPDISENQCSVGSLTNRPICEPPLQSTPNLCQLEAGPIGSSNRCLLPGLVGSPSEDLCKSPLGPDRQSPITNSQSEHPRAHSDCPCLESSSLVSSAPAEVGQSTSTYSCIIRGDTACVSESPSRCNTTTGRVGHIRERCQRSHLSGTATDLVLSSWRDKSSKSYDSCFRKWAGWCSERNRDPICGPISDVANFLAQLYQDGYQYRSLNSYRSAISTTHDHIDGHPVGQHPIITRLMRGAFNKRPPQPRYSITWDVCKVTLYISSMGENHSLSLKSLSLKLVMLLALTRPSRSHDLSNLDLRCMKILPDGVEFKSNCLAKQSRPSRPAAPFVFPAFTTDKNLCPKEALSEYVSRTESFRGTGSDRKTKLFLSYIKPHSPISSSSIARWILAMLSLAGIDTSNFKAHSVRSASVSAAASAGVSTNQIMEAADWSSESVFQRFYYKPSSVNAVGVSVLSCTPTDSLQTSR